MGNKRRKTTGTTKEIPPRHESTQQVPTGLGSQAAAAPGRVAKGWVAAHAERIRDIHAPYGYSRLQGDNVYHHRPQACR